MNTCDHLHHFTFTAASKVLAEGERSGGIVDELCDGLLENSDEACLQYAK